MIVKNSDEEKVFINNLIKTIRSIDTSDLLDVESLENVVLTLVCFMERIQEENLKIVNITMHSKTQWNEKYNRDLKKYKLTKHVKDWKQFKRIVKNTK